MRARHVVIAAGAVERRDRAACPPQARVPVRPVKGQILRLRDPAGPGLLERVVRFEGGYLVPRADGRYVLGRDRRGARLRAAATAGGVYELLRDAHELVRASSELQIEELCVGLRPGTPDNAARDRPGRAATGLTWATGPPPQRHPARAADRRAGGRALAGEPASPLPRPAPPDRFAAVPA